MQTIAEKWMEKGMKKGMEKGMLKGVEKGKIEKALEAAKKMQLKGFDPKIIMEITGLNREDIDKLAATSH